MVPRENPYDWTVSVPRISLPRRDLVERAARVLLAGQGCVLLGGMGMGKSVALHQLRAHLTRPEVTVLLLRGIPSRTPTVTAVLNALARRLGLPESADPDAGELFGRYLEEHREVQALVLLFDELDQYAVEDHGRPLGRILFDHLEEVRRDVLAGRLGLFAAGGLGLYALQDMPGSPFMSRAQWLTPEPFTTEELAQLAAPLAARTALAPEVLQAVHLASGGNPALATFGLERLWERSHLSARVVTEIYTEFREAHGEFLQKVQRTIARPEWSEAALRVWSLVLRGGGEVPRRALQEACAAPGSVHLTGERALRLLRAAGLIRVVGPLDADPVQAWPVASILNLPEPAPGEGDLGAQLALHLQDLLGRLHAMAPDFYRRATTAEGRQLVPEATFAAFLALGLASLGWSVERESQYGAGRTDIKARRAGAQGIALVELKIWGRNDYQSAHRQVEGYWSADVEAAAVVMIAPRAEAASWRERYREVCLAEIPDVEARPVRPPLAGRFMARGQKAVEHLLLALPG